MTSSASSGHAGSQRRVPNPHHPSLEIRDTVFAQYDTMGLVTQCQYAVQPELPEWLLAVAAPEAV